MDIRYRRADCNLEFAAPSNIPAGTTFIIHINTGDSGDITQMRFMTQGRACCRSGNV